MMKISAIVLNMPKMLTITIGDIFCCNSIEISLYNFHHDWLTSL